MQTIATSVDDSFQRMRDKLEAEKRQVGSRISLFFFLVFIFFEKKTKLPVSGGFIVGLTELRPF